MKVVIFANTFYLVSGGDVIFANIAKEFLKNKNEVTVVTNEKGGTFCLDQGISKTSISIQPASWIDKLPLWLVESYKAFISSIREVFTNRKSPGLIFASSFFWPDIFSAVIAKIKNPKAKLVVGVYLLFPPPFSFKKYHGGQLKLILLFISQLVSLFLIKIFADLVLTASQKDTVHFKKSLAIRGGIDFKQIKNSKGTGKKYDLVYFGRFHSQKGILDLLDIWSKVKRSLPATNFLMVGSGPLEEEIKEKAKKLKLLSSITFTGLLSGTKKYTYLKSCRIFTSSSRFDTGNMALDEVLACGVPGVVYDLPHLHYPNGVIKIPIGKKQKMAKEIIKLLPNTYKRSLLGKQGKDFIRHYDWSVLYKKIKNLLIT